MFVVLLLLFGVNMTNAQQNPPPTAVKIVVDTLHGIPVADPYRWLEDQNSPETRVWIRDQNEYTGKVMQAITGMDKINQRVGQLVNTDYIDVPIERNGRYFVSKRMVGQQQCIIYVREGLSGEDHALLDPHGLSEDQSVVAEIGDVSKDGKLLAYLIRKGGEDENEIHFKDVESGLDLPDSLPRALYFGVSINADNSGFYYVRVDEKGGCVFYHEFGTDFDADPLIFGGNYGPSEYIEAYLCEDRKYLYIGVHYGSSGTRTDVYFADVINNGPVTKVIAGIEAGFFGQIVDDKMYIRTNHNAPNWCVWLADLSNPSIENWTPIIKETEKAVLEGFSLVGGRIFVRYIENVSSHVKVFEPDGSFVREMELPSLGSVDGIYGQWSADEGFFVFSSYHIPETIYRMIPQTGEYTEWAKPDIPLESDDVTVKQVWYNSADGTRIPMFLAYRNGVNLDGNNPTLLAGYGGFNISLLPSFKHSYAFWIDAGGVLAIPSLRGGGEFGEKWHQDGMLDKKQNTFDDFIAAAGWLIDNNYTNPSKLAIRGGSNGGLLVGATVNQRPDLFKAVVCTYPLLDMVRYHKFLMGPYWISEYGSADSAEQFEYIRKYSPYHNVKSGGNYPTVLFVTGDYDTRVAPLHARKMTALLQASTGSDNPVLLWYDTKIGHAGSTSVSKEIEEVSVQMGFLCWQLGLEI